MTLDTPIQIRGSISEKSNTRTFGLSELKQVIGTLVKKHVGDSKDQQVIISYMFNNLATIRDNLLNNKMEPILSFQQLMNFVNSALKRTGYKELIVANKSIFFDISNLYSVEEINHDTQVQVETSLDAVEQTLEVGDISAQTKDVNGDTKDGMISTTSMINGQRLLEKKEPSLDYNKINNAQKLEGQFGKNCIEVRKLFNIQTQLFKRKDFSLNSSTARYLFNELNQRNNNNNLLEKFEQEVKEIKALTTLHEQTLSDFDRFLNTTVAALVRPYSLLYIEGINFFINNNEEIIKHTPNLVELPGLIVKHLQEKKENGIADLKKFYGLIQKIDTSIENAKRKAIRDKLLASPKK